MMRKNKTFGVIAVSLILVSFLCLAKPLAAKKIPARATAPVQPTATLPSGPDWTQLDIAVGDQLQIEGLRGDVNVSFVDAGPRLAIRVRQGASVQNQWIAHEGHQIVVRTPTQLAIADWDRVNSGQINPVSYLVEVVAGPINTLVAWRDGQVKVTGAKQPFSVSGIKGKLTLEDNASAGRVQWLEGSIQVARHKGSLNLVSTSAAVEVGDSEGNIQIQNHVGRTKLKGVQGDLKFTSFRGVLTGEDMKAGTDIQAGQASINLKGLTGSLRGQNEQGDTVIQLGAKSTMKFESDKGDIRVRLAKGVGARLNLVTEGRLIAPPSIRVGVDGRNRTASGRVDGDEASTVNVHSKTGQITVGM